jgi:hypothetical protein
MGPAKVATRSNRSLPELTPLSVAAVALAVLTAWAIVAVAGVGFKGMVAGDGRLFQHVATHPLGPIRAGDDAFRYGRILFPAFGWLLALGHPSAIVAGFVVVNVVATAALAGGVGALTKMAGGDARGGLLVLAIPIVWGIARFSYADTLATTLAVLGCVSWKRDRSALAWLLCAGAALTRETLVLALVPPAFLALRRRDLRDLVVWSSAAVPLLGWWGYVRLESGQWPPLAHTLQRTTAVSLPFVGAVKAWGPGGYVAAATFGAVTIVLSLVTAVFLRHGNPAWGHAVVFGLFTACFGAGVWPEWGDTLRLLLPAHAFLLPGFIAAAPRWRGLLRGLSPPRPPLTVG